MAVPMRTLGLAGLAIAFCVPPFPAVAIDDPSVLCEIAAADAAAMQDVPNDIMQGITLTETGRRMEGRLRPWPWAINEAGEGHWFATRDEMLNYARQIIEQGATNFDLGCFQLNYRWHAGEFASLEDMVDPQRNADYAASHLQQKYQEKGSWESAVAAYHSATPEYASRYLTRFMAIYAGLTSAPKTPRVAATEPVAKPNLFPFFVASGSGQGASLVPMVAGGRRLIGGDQ